MLARVLSQNRVAPEVDTRAVEAIAIAGVPLLLIVAQGDLGTAIVFVGIFFAMLFWAGVPWQLLTLLASPVVSWSWDSTRGCGARGSCCSSRSSSGTNRSFGEGLVRRRANVMTGFVGPLVWENMKPRIGSTPQGLPRSVVDPRGSGYHVHSVAGGDWIGRMVRPRLSRRTAETTRLSPRAVHRLHLRRRRRGAGFLGVTIALALFLFLFSA
jgi:rod shape determining protein RodA